MDYREFLIYLNLKGIENDKILKIEEYISEKGINHNEFFDKNFLLGVSNIFPNSVIKKLYDYDPDLLNKLYDYCYREKISVLTYEDPIYPKKLKEIENPPKILYIRGNLEKILKPGIAVVGSRKSSDYGRYVVDYLIDGLAEYDISIISGMAYGIDSLSHLRALKNKMDTVAVLGCGVDVIYPKKNINLYGELCNKGAVLSEYPPGLGPMQYRFPLRNRIISGLSRGVIVVEAQKKSGSLITARLAAEQGKEVFAVPGNINSIYSKGTNLLIRDGANIFNRLDDLDYLIRDFKKTVSSTDSELEISLDEQRIVEQIKNGNYDINMISINLKEDISFISSLVTVLELKNIVNCRGNKIFLNIK